MRDRIRDLRTDEDYTQERVAKAVGITYVKEPYPSGFKKQP